MGLEFLLPGIQCRFQGFQIYFEIPICCIELLKRLSNKRVAKRLRDVTASKRPHLEIRKDSSNDRMLKTGRAARGQRMALKIQLLI